jgi:hypothetical protein
MHILTRVERQRYLYFVCPSQPKMELVSLGEPLKCPVCRMIKPIEMGLIECDEYSGEFGAEIGEYHP